MARIHIGTFCKGSHVTRADGARVRQAIEAHWADSEALVLDFTDIRVASVSFFDESLGLLAKRYPLEEVTERIRVQHIDPSDRELLNRIVSLRAKERESTQPSASGPAKCG